MRISFLLALLLCACAAAPADLERRPVRVSSFPSTVPGISIPNTHVVGRSEGKVLRGMAPWTRQHVKELADADVNEILIFRNDDEDGKTVEREMALLRTEPRLRSVVHLPMAWKALEFQPACEKTLAALRVIDDRAARSSHSVYFHCTMGEDRTGYLAALYRMLFEGADAQAMFREEMCRWGYADGSPVKPAAIAAEVHESLTPVFARLVRLHEEGKLTAQRLDPSVCREKVELSRGWEKAYRCRADDR